MLGQGSLLVALPGSLWADEADAVTISILHTTDLHGHILPTVDYNDHPDLGGLARCATQIRQWRRANPNSVLLDIGDVYQGTELGLRTRGATMIRCLNALAYDAWVVGNHEFDWGLEAFADCVGLSAMPVLAGNAMVAGKPVGTLGESAGPLARLRPWLLKEVAGFRLAIISLTTPALATWLPPEKWRGLIRSKRCARSCPRWLRTSPTPFCSPATWVSPAATITPTGSARSPANFRNSSPVSAATRIRITRAKR
jgi:2',3'-cyclic-nucleotide 2'-phosphodiesterase/3'-nucleotidase